MAGEIELLTERALSGFVGYDAAGLAGRQSAVSMGALSAIRGLACQNNAATPNTQFDMNAGTIVLIGSDGSALAVSGALTTNNIATAGPAANGRDQAGAFTNSTWVHLWWIYNGATLATLSSASATAPTLPSGYTHKAYAGAVYLTSGGTLRLMRIRGDLCTAQISTDVAALSSGAATVETAVDISAFVPANALEFLTNALMINTNAAANSLRFILAPGSTAFANIFGSPTTGYGQALVTAPYVGPTIYYQNSQTSGSSFYNVLGFRVPNGAA